MEKVIIQEKYPVDAETLWNALTRLDEMKLWYFENIDAFEARVGGKSKFLVQSGGRTFTHLWEVTEVKPLEKIAYNWKYAEYKGDSSVCFGLNDLGSETILTLTMEVLEDFPADISEFKRESAVGGWTYLLGVRLKTYLENEHQR